jgi:tetratricopeptide (TPR) repeat protein
MESDSPSPSLIPPPDLVRTTVSEDAAPPSRARSLPPMPDVEPILEEGAAARAREDWEGALEAYKRALFVMPGEAGLAHASIYASVAEVKRAQGKALEAETNFEKALVIHPKHMRSIDGLIALATDGRDWARLAAARRRRAEAFDDPEDKASELCLVAQIEEERLGDAEKALATMAIASIHRPDDIGILLKLRDLYMHAGAWPQLLDVLDDLVRVSTDQRHRGTFRFVQGDVALGRLREEPRGLAFLELALDEDPQCDRALSALVAVRTRREEWPELAAVYERLLDRYAGLGDKDRAWEVCKRLGTLRRDRLHDGPGAMEAISAAVVLRPDDAESRATLAELHAAKGDRAAAVRELQIAAVHAPLRAQTYRRLFELHQRAQRTDRAWVVATCLEDLSAADVGQELVVEQYRPNGPIRPTSGFADEWWEELVDAHGADPIVSALLATIGETAIALRIEELAENKQHVVLDPETKQDRDSTASAVRTFVWAARVLGIPVPDLYVLDAVPNGIAAIPAASPSTALGPVVLAGRTVQELSFLAGRHLVYYRPAHRPLVFFPTLGELSLLVLTAMRLVIPSLSIPPGGNRVTEQLSSRLAPEKKDELRDIVARLDARGGKLDLLAWIRGVELTAQRAGLILAGDLRTAMRIVREEERTIGELAPEMKRGDLLAYAASEAYAELRERIGVAIRAS